jgi:hypothetical protein
MDFRMFRRFGGTLWCIGSSEQFLAAVVTCSDEAFNAAPLGGEP